MFSGCSSVCACVLGRHCQTASLSTSGLEELCRLATVAIMYGTRIDTQTERLRFVTAPRRENTMPQR